MDEKEAKALALEILATIPDIQDRLAYADHWAATFRLISGLQEVGIAFMEAAREIREQISKKP